MALFCAITNYCRAITEYMCTPQHAHSFSVGGIEGHQQQNQLNESLVYERIIQFTVINVNGPLWVQSEVWKGIKKLVHGFMSWEGLKHFAQCMYKSYGSSTKSHLSAQREIPHRQAFYFYFSVAAVGRRRRPCYAPIYLRIYDWQWQKILKYTWSTFIILQLVLLPFWLESDICCFGDLIGNAKYTPVLWAVHIIH